jgi:hypothetical protein
MPRIDDELLNCAVYFYTSMAGAKAGHQSGGCGFLIGVPSETKMIVPGRSEPQDFWHLHAVTSKHVIDAGCRVIRMGGQNAEPAYGDTSPEDWFLSIDDDLAVSRAILSTSFTDLRLGFIRIGQCVTGENLSGDPKDEFQFGLGDDVVLIGRMITHDGKQRNRPYARFGNISMMPDERDPVDLGEGRSQVAYLIDCRSLPGTSGSAVLTFPAVPQFKKEGFQLWVGTSKLLGVDCAHLPRWTEVYESDRRTRTGHQVEMNSGVAVVIPAWRLVALLQRNDVKAHRRVAEQEWARELQSGHPVRLVGGAAGTTAGDKTPPSTKHSA